MRMTLRAKPPLVQRPSPSQDKKERIPSLRVEPRLPINQKVMIKMVRIRDLEHGKGYEDSLGCDLFCMLASIIHPTATCLLCLTRADTTQEHEEHQPDRSSDDLEGEQRKRATA
jgi:hypothetical protein